MPFLTDYDSRATVKGSRDPLGLVPVWSRFGRFVVGNLTTVSNSVRGFTTLLLGYYFAEEVLRREGLATGSTLAPFLKLEQLAGYCRYHVNQDDDFRGRDRVVLRLQKGPKVTLGADQPSQILSNQKIYGLWGLFSVAARESGLLARGEPILTPVAREFVERQYIARLAKEGIRSQSVVDLLRREHADVHLDGRDAGLATSLANLLSQTYSASERSFYRNHLVDGGEEEGTHGRQPLLAQLLESLPAKTDFGMAQLEATIGRARKLRSGQELANHLDEIRRLEGVLVPMESAFGFLLSRDRQKPSDVARELREAWGRSLGHIVPSEIEPLRPTIASAFRGEGLAADRFVRIASALSKGAYEDVVRLLLEHNAFVMQARGSQPWARLENGKVDVRYHDESGRLVPGDELASTWRNTYFINSLHLVTTTLRAA